MRQTAWLHTAPERPPGEKLADGKAVQLDPPTRLKAHRDAGIVPLLPPNPAEYLTDWLFEIGPTVATMGGPTRFGWVEMAAWQEISGIELEPWEARILRRLSAEYADELGEAKKHDRAAPYAGEKQDIVARRGNVDRKIDMQFAGLKKKD